MIRIIQLALFYSRREIDSSVRPGKGLTLFPDKNQYKAVPPKEDTRMFHAVKACKEVTPAINGTVGA